MALVSTMEAVHAKEVASHIATGFQDYHYSDSWLFKLVLPFSLHALTENCAAMGMSKIQVA